jgi:hypothetical protein
LIARKRQRAAAHQWSNLMAEMTWTTLAIGGHVPANKLAEFRELCDEYFGGFGAVDKPKDLIDRALRDGESVTFADTLDFGNADELEAVCKRWGLTYWKHWDAVGGQFDSGIEIWRPGMERAKEQTATCEQDQPALTMSQLQALAEQGHTLQQVIEMLDEFSATKVPPLTIGLDYHEEDENEDSGVAADV